MITNCGYCDADLSDEDEISYCCHADLAKVVLRQEKLAARVTELHAELHAAREANLHVDGKVAAVKISKAKARAAAWKGAAASFYRRAKAYQNLAWSQVALLNTLITRAEKAEARVAELERLLDCGQDRVCAVYPGCNRHWEERNRELVESESSACGRVAELEQAIRAALEVRPCVVSMLAELHKAKVLP